MNNKTICALFLLLAVASANTFENLEFLDDDNVIVNEDIEFIAIKKANGCMESIKKIIPDLKAFIKDVNAKRDVQTLIDDLQAIFGEINGICDSCDLSKPSMYKYERPSFRDCAIDAALLADTAVYIVKLVGNPLTFIPLIESVAVFVTGIPMTVLDCGIRMEAN